MDEPPRFDTEEEAVEWMTEQVDDPYQDNERFAFQDDADAMAEFQRLSDKGCCGSAEYEVIVNGRLALIGCNYGH